MMATRQGTSDAACQTEFPLTPLLNSEQKCQRAIEQLYRSLPVPVRDDGNDILHQHRQCGEAFAMFMDREWNRPGEHTSECGFLLDAIADLLLEHQPAYSLGFHIAFIEKISTPFFLSPQTIGGESTRSHNLRCYRWIYRGMKEAETPESITTPDDSDGDGKRDSNQDGKHDIPASKDLSHLPKSLTGLSYCAHCYSQGFLSSYCEDCAIKTDSHLTITTGYCSTRCYELDRQRHKPICELHKQFERATRLMKALHMMVETTNTTLSLEDSYERDGILFLTESSRHIEAMQGKCVVHPFAQDESMSEEHARAALEDEYSPNLSVTLMSRGQALWLWIGKQSHSFIMS